MHGIVEDTTSAADTESRFHETGGVAGAEPGPKGRAPRKKKPVRLCDVAHAAGVSIATVSLVLSDNPRISATTQQRVRRIAHRLGYRPIRAAQVLAGRTSTALAVLLPAP